MKNKQDYYSILGVSRDVTAAELKSAYRKLSKKYHPDVNPGSLDAEAKMREVNEAYGVLSEPEKRAEYDQVGSTSAHSSGMQKDSGVYTDSSDINFDSMFGSGFANYVNRTNKKYERNRGRDTSLNMKIGFTESVSGAEKEISISFSEKCEFCDEKEPAAESAGVCSQCNGAGKERVTVRSGFGKMTQTRLCSLCKGTGKDLGDACTKCLGKGYVKAVKKIKVKIPKGIVSGQTITVDGMGEPGLHGGSRGDLVIKVSVG